MGFVLLACISIMVITTNSQATRSSLLCVPDFWKNQDVFDRDKVIFVFCISSQFVHDNEKIRKEPTLPFPCDDPRMQGVFPEILLQMGRSEPFLKEALCVYAGNECSFDGTVQFVKDAARNNTGHQFIGGPYLTFLRSRRTDFTINSAPAFSESMVLMHRDDKKLRPWKDARSRVIQPFTWQAWLVVAGTGLCIVVFFAGFVRCHAPRSIWVRWVLAGTDENTPTEQLMTWGMLKLGFTVFIMLVVLLYEITFAIHALLEGDPIITDMTQLRNLNLTRLGVIGNGAAEEILRDAVGINTKSRPWKAINSLEEGVDLLHSGELDFVFAFLTDVDYTLRKKNACSRIRVDNLGSRSIQTCGWYYSPMVPPAKRTRIDKALNEQYHKHSVFENNINYEGCTSSDNPKYKAIDFRVMMIIVGVPVGTILIFFLICLVVPWRRIFRRAVESVEEDAKNDEAEESTELNSTEEV